MSIYTYYIEQEGGFSIERGTDIKRTRRFG